MDQRKKMTIDLPTPLEKLNDLAYNLWFSWNPEVRDLFKEIDIDLWREVNFRRPGIASMHI